MHRRILRSTLFVVLVTTLLLGLPLLITTWQLVEDLNRTELTSRLERVATEVTDQEGVAGAVPGRLNTARLSLAVPQDGRLVVRYPTTRGRVIQTVIGAAPDGPTITERMDLGPGGTLELTVPADTVRVTQLRTAVGIVIIMVATVVTGAVVAGLTARRLSDPLRELGRRAARLGSGDFRPVPHRYGIPELDRVSDVLDSSAAELAGLLARERELVGDVSHQLRSRLTAVRLRLDELGEHPDPDVVEEAGAAMAQVDRLTAAVDEMVAAARTVRTAGAQPLDVGGLLESVVAEFTPLYVRERRSLDLDVEPGLTARATPARLREATVVLVENALVHGAGAVTITATTAARPGPGDERVLVEVADAGPGIPEGLVGRVFERGFSGAHSSGLGLALARALIESDGGRLELRRARPALFAIFLTPGEVATEVAVAGAVREPR